MSITAELHAAVDDVLMLVGSLLQPGRGFAQPGAASAPTHGELYAAVRRSPPVIAWERVRRHPAPGFWPSWASVPVEVAAEGVQTQIDLALGPAGERDTLIVYHHGLRESWHTLLPSLLQLQPALRARADWVAIKALYHRTAAEQWALVSCRDRFLRTMAYSVAMAEQIHERLAPRYRRVVLAGVSLGGLVALGTAAYADRYDLYVPIVAGPDLADVLFRSSIARLFHAGFRKSEQRRGPEATAYLDLTSPLRRSHGAPIRPLLARDDRVFRLEPQLRAYARIPRARVKVAAGSHTTVPARVWPVARHLAQLLAPAAATRRSAPALARRQPSARPGATVVA